MKKWLTPSLNWLLIFVPVAIGLRVFGAGHGGVALFVCSALAIIPLAGIMGSATERLAHRMGEGIGGLLNATFGNAAELIIALMALHKGLIGVVKASITGSIIGNLLLVLGASVLAGGAKYSEQRFNRTAAQTSTASLLLAAIGLLIPSVFHSAATNRVGGWTPLMEQRLSLAIAVVLFGLYFSVLIFSLRTHKSLFEGESAQGQETGTSIKPQAAGPNAQAHNGNESPIRAIIELFVATAFVALMSEFLVGTVEAAQAKMGVSEVFIGVIVVAIVGNAAEHSTAVWMARKNKMDLSINIAVGSSLQIALFVAPVLVFVSWLFGHPMDLEFSIPEVVAVIIAVHVASEIVKDGRSHWLEGVQLLAVYVILGILFYFLPAEHPAPALPANQAH